MSDITPAQLLDMLQNGDTLNVRVTPKAAANRIVLEDARVRLYITTVAEDGKANKAALKLLAKALRLPVSALSLVQGEKSREKTIKIDTSRLKA